MRNFRTKTTKVLLKSIVDYISLGCLVKALKIPRVEQERSPEPRKNNWRSISIK
ncbi:MAG: hypothetical protein AAGE84_00090 [Cyanobacteria bacterium P01_G01_bin.39]